MPSQPFGYHRRPVVRALLALLAANAMLSGCGRGLPQYQRVVATGEAVNIPLAGINDGGVHFYTYEFSGGTVNFFVRTDGRGQLRTHFDACYGCYRYREGYVHQGGEIVCRACRLGFALKEPYWDYIGACAPITLKSRVAGERLVISLAHLERGKRFFD